MVRWGGHEQGLAARGSRLEAWTRGSGRPGAMTLIAGIAVVMLAGVPTSASAQAAVGFQGGVSVDPEQVFGGVFWQTGDLGRGIRLRPGIDGATGDGYRIATINMDFVYGYPLANGWTFLAGGGPSVVITRIPELEFRDTGVGFHSLIGFGHDSGFFTEIRLGSGRAQQLKFGIGWAIALN